MGRPSASHEKSIQQKENVEPKDYHQDKRLLHPGLQGQKRGPNDAT
jgi:hypothetical protein